MSYIFRSKITIPSERGTLLERPHLYDRLNAAVSKHALTVLSAPPGSGKTSLLAQWSRRASLSVRWLSLDEQDNEPLRFWRYLVGAIASSDFPADDFQSLGATDSEAWRGLPAQLYDEWTNLPPFALVLDDFHVISNPLLLDSFNRWLDNLPPTLHIVLASRTTPDLALPRRRVRGQLAELDIASLSLSVPETAEFLNTLSHLNLSADLVEKLAARTEGWIAGVQLAALALQTSSAPPAQIIEKFGGSHVTVFDYFAQELFERQPPAVQDFLLKTGLPPLFDADLAVRLTGGNAAEVSAQLAYLEDANLFLFRLDESRTLYRYHSLWATFLADLLHRRRPEVARDLKIRLANYYAEHTQPDLAISFALSASDFNLAAHLLEAAAPALLSESRYQAFRQWVEALPPAALTETAELRQNYAWALALSGQTDAALNALREPDYASPNAAALQAVVAAQRAVPHEVIAFAEQALPQLSPSHFYYNALLLLAGQAYRQSGQNAAAEEMLQKAIATSRATKNVSYQLIGLAYLAELSVGQGNLYRARQNYEDALQLTERSQHSPLVGLIYYGLGNIYFEWNELADAERWLTKAYAASQKMPTENNGAVALVCVRLARLYLAKGEIATAHDWTQRALSLAKTGDLPFAAPHVAAWQARFALALNDLGTARQHLTAYSLDNPATLLNPLQSYEFLTALRFWLRQEHSRPALELLQKYIAPDQPALAVEIQLLRALAYFELGQTEAALADLQLAFGFAEPGGFVRIFLDELLFSPSFSRLVEVAAQTESFGQSDLFRKVVAELDLDTPSSVLSEREQEVLELVAAGFSTRQIADRLIISPGTVKTHLNHIYEKLNVHSRTQALARASELNLL